MTDAMWNECFGGTREERAARLDGEAVADPTKASSAEVELARFLANMLEYDYKSFQKILKLKARELLQYCRGDIDGLWEVLEGKAQDMRWLQWVISEDVSIYGVIPQIKGAYSRHMEQQRKHAVANTAAGRKARYANYPGVLS